VDEIMNSINKIVDFEQLKTNITKEYDDQANKVTHEEQEEVATQVRADFEKNIWNIDDHEKRSFFGELNDFEKSDANKAYESIANKDAFNKNEFKRQENNFQTKMFVVKNKKYKRGSLKRRNKK